MNFLHRKKKTNDRNAEQVPVAGDRLNELCQGDSRLHKALSNFLLLEPQRQLPFLGTAEDFAKKASSALARNNPIEARTDFETAARIEIYNGNIEKVKTFLEKAQGLPDKYGEESRLTLLANLERAIEIAAQYFHNKPVPVEVEKTILVTA